MWGVKVQLHVIIICIRLKHKLRHGYSSRWERNSSAHLTAICLHACFLRETDRVPSAIQSSL